MSLILDSLKPDQLLVDLRECHRPSRCCKIQIIAIECFSHGFAIGSPRAVKLEGLMGFDDFALELFKLWTCKRIGCSKSASATSERHLPDADVGLRGESQAELNKMI